MNKRRSYVPEIPRRENSNRLKTSRKKGGIVILDKNGERDIGLMERI
jgi:hypothetical protein